MSRSNTRSCLGLLALGFAAFAQSQYTQTNLVSDGFVNANFVDHHLVNPWGLAFKGSGPWWVADNGASVSTLYNSTGAPFPLMNPLVVDIKPEGQTAPTGLVANNGTAFNITENGKTAPAVFIFATEDGRIDGWNPTVDSDDAIAVRVNSNAVYKGAAILNDHLYVTNFRSGFVEDYNNNFTKVGQFTDTSVPSGYAPFGIQRVGDDLFVTFAMQDALKHDDVAGAGHGFVDVFEPDGTMERRFAGSGVLNSPWGIAQAPSNFGPASNDILIGNFGDGKINIFTPAGAFVGPMFNSHGVVIVNHGLWSLQFGNGGTAGSTNTLFFTAGLNGEQDGLFGKITAP